MTLATEDDPFHQDLLRGLQQAADSLGLDLRIAAAERDVARQTSQVESFIGRRLDAIVIVPVSPGGIVGAVLRANRARVPVFTAELAADSGTVVAHIASDDRQGGRLLGEYVARRLSGGGNVVVLDQPTLARVRERVTGFREALAAYPNIRIVAAPAADRCSQDDGWRHMNNLLATDERIDAVFGTNDDCALGALAAIQQAERANVLVTGFGATPEARAAIARKSALAADAAEDPVALGRRVVEVVAAKLRGAAVPARVSVPVRLVDRDSLAGR